MTSSFSAVTGTWMVLNVEVMTFALLFSNKAKVYQSKGLHGEFAICP